MREKEIELSDLYVLYEVGANNKIIFVNSAFCKLANYSESEVIGMPHQNIRDSNMPISILRDLEKSISIKGFWEGLIKYISKDGDLYWLHTIALKKVNNSKESFLFIGLNPTKSEIKEIEYNFSDSTFKEEEHNIKELVSWSDALSVGFAPIDAHHKNLVDLLNRLNSVTLSGKGRRVIEDILNELAEYTVYHFGYEEEQMQKFNYPNFDEHKEEHIAFVSQVTDFINKFKLGESHLDEDVLNFLKKWLSKHILGTDKKLGGYLSPSKKI